jgi:signal transduction histidine kinase
VSGANRAGHHSLFTHGSPWVINDYGETDFTKTIDYEETTQSLFDDFHDYMTNLGKTEEELEAEREAEKERAFKDVEWLIKEELMQEYMEKLTLTQLWTRFMRDYADDFNNRSSGDAAPDEETYYYGYEYGDYDDYDEDDDYYSLEDYFEAVRWEIEHDMGVEYRNKLTRKEVYHVFENDYGWQFQDEYRGKGNTMERLDDLARDPSIVFYIRAGEEVVANTNLSFDEILSGFTHVSYFNPTPDSSENAQRFIFALTDDYMAARNLELKEMNRIVNEFLLALVLWSVAYLICFSYLIYSAGRKADGGELSLIWLDRIFTELILALFILTILGGLFFAVEGSYDYVNTKLFGYVYGLGLAVLFTIAYTLLLSLVRHFKNGTFFKNLLIYKVLSKVGFLYSKSNPMLKITIMVTALGVLTMIPFVGIITVPFALWVAFRHAKDFQKLKEGIRAVRNGDFTEFEHQPPIDGIYTEFRELSADVNEISKGLSEEVERRTKSERLKTELIINVSHDIRTPLTSLITYSDLLEKEIVEIPPDNDKVKKYSKIISQKSERLKTLTDDLFESAKAASGNVSVSLENVDVNALLIQGLAELDTQIKQSTLEFKLNITQDKVIMALADGRLLWRVIDNLISNALRYSLENSRVYISVFEEGDGENEESVIIEMKNVSKTELNIPEDEITERFKRGDLSRNTEGSGLGLDIASSLMECQGGSLSVKIDGDLFKACIKIRKGEILS